MSNSPAAATPEDRYREYLTMYRHYSNVRFLLIPIYLTLAIALGAAWGQGVDGADHAGVPPWLIPGAGAVTSVPFIGLEVILDGYIRKFRLAAARHDDEFVARMPPLWKVTPWLVHLVYLAGLAFWTVLLVESF